jgi:hypothetical protein
VDRDERLALLINEQVGGSVPGFAARYSAPLRTALEKGDPPRIVWLDHDGSLNER